MKVLAQPLAGSMLLMLAWGPAGYCEVDGSLEWSGWYERPVVVTPPGTEDELKTEARPAHGSLLRLPVPDRRTPFTSPPTAALSIP